MRLVHITTDVRGGAGIAAFRLHKAMLDDGLSSVLVNKFYENSKLKCFKVHPEMERNKIKRLKLFFLNKINSIVVFVYNRLHLEFHSGIRAQYRLDKILNKDDIVIIHWVADFLDYSSFFQTVDKNLKVFFYVHDFNVIMGRIHTLFDKTRTKNRFVLFYENYLCQRKHNYLKCMNNLSLIANSSFTYKVLKANHCESFSQKLFKVGLGLPQGELVTVDKIKAKSFMGFSEDDFVILVSSNELEIKRKGYDRLLEIFKTFQGDEYVKFVFLGKQENSTLLKYSNFFSFTSWDPMDKSNIFSGADVLLSTSYEETFGQTIIEAYACTTPAIVYNNSALIELVVHQKTGFIAETNEDVISYINQLKSNLVLQNTMGNLARERYLTYFTSKIQLSHLKKELNLQ